MYFTSQKPFCKIAIILFLCLFIPFFLISCNDDDDDDDDVATGSIIVKITDSTVVTKENATFTTFAAKASRILFQTGKAFAQQDSPCTKGVVEIMAVVYDGNGVIIASGGPWSCSTKSGLIENVPAGSNRTILWLAKDDTDIVIYRSEIRNVTVLAGENITVQMDPPILFQVSEIEHSQDTISWTGLEYAVEYEIVFREGSPQQAPSNDNNEEQILKTFVTADPVYSDPFVSNSDWTYLQIRAADGFGNRGPAMFYVRDEDNQNPQPPVTSDCTTNPTVADDASFVIDEDTSLSDTLDGFDPQDDPLQFIIESNPSHGQISNFAPATGDFTYVPDLNFNGSDSFQFKTTDGNCESEIATVSVDILPVNDCPRAVSETISVPKGEDTVKYLRGVDADNDLLSFSIIESPSQGTVSLSDPTTGEFVFFMPLDATGQDSFVYRVDDGDCSDTATIIVNTDTDDPVNDCPTALDENVTLNEDQSLTGEVVAEDDNDDTLIYTIVASPAQGQISGFDELTGEYTYAPDPNYYGEDTFTFNASDGVCESNSATVTITVLPVNDAPVLAPNNYSLESIYQYAADPDGSTVEYILNSGGSNGVTDADSIGGIEPERGIAVIGMDNTNGTWQYSLHPLDIWSDFGTDLDETSALVLGESDRIRFIPFQGYFGEVTKGIEFRAWDQTDGANPGDTGVDTTATRFSPPRDTWAYSEDSAFASITVEKVNDCPEAEDEVYTIEENTSLSDIVNATDSDGDPLTFSIESVVSNGQITNFNPDTGAFTYIPGENFNGTDSFTFTANDGICTSNVAMITINVTPVNDCPTAYPETYHIEENELVEDFLEGSDPDGDPLTYTIVAGPERGTVEIVNAATGEFVYTPEDYQAGTDTFTFQVDDGDCSDTAVITINITDMNICPVAYDETYVIDEDTELTSFLEGFDTDKGPESLTFEVLTDLEFGMVTYDPQTGEFTYAPNESFLGKDQFTFRVYDGECYSSPATITIYVSPATADCPAAFDEVFTVNSGSSVSGFLTAVDPEGDSLTYSITNGPSYGEISDFNPVTGSFTYAPNPNFHGVDTFTFTATDGNCISNVATISINVYQ